MMKPLCEKKIAGLLQFMHLINDIYAFEKHKIHFGRHSNSFTSFLSHRFQCTNEWNKDGISVFFLVSKNRWDYRMAFAKSVFQEMIIKSSLIFILVHLLSIKGNWKIFICSNVSFYGLKGMKVVLKILFLVLIKLIVYELNMFVWPIIDVWTHKVMIFVCITNFDVEIDSFNRCFLLFRWTLSRRCRRCDCLCHKSETQTYIWMFITESVVWWS